MAPKIYLFTASSLYVLLGSDATSNVQSNHSFYSKHLDLMLHVMSNVYGKSIQCNIEFVQLRHWMKERDSIFIWTNGIMQLHYANICA